MGVLGTPLLYTYTELDLFTELEFSMLLLLLLLGSVLLLLLVEGELFSLLLFIKFVPDDDESDFVMWELVLESELLALMLTLVLFS